MSQWVQTVGMIIGALMGGGLVKAIVDYLRDRRTGKLDESKFEFQTLTEMNASLRQQLKELRAETEQDRRQFRADLDEERRQRRALEEDLAAERQKTRALEARVSELEGRHNG